MGGYYGYGLGHYGYGYGLGGYYGYPGYTVDWLEDTLDIPTTTDGPMDLTMVLAPIFWEREKLKRRLPNLRPPRLLLDLPDTNIPLVPSMDFPTPKDGLMDTTTESVVSLLPPLPPSLLMLILSTTVMVFPTGDNFELDSNPYAIIAKSNHPAKLHPEDHPFMFQCNLEAE